MKIIYIDEKIDFYVVRVCLSNLFGGEIDQQFTLDDIVRITSAGVKFPLNDKPKGKVVLSVTFIPSLINKEEKAVNNNISDKFIMLVIN